MKLRIVAALLKLAGSSRPCSFRTFELRSFVRSFVRSSNTKRGASNVEGRVCRGTEEAFTSHGPAELRKRQRGKVACVAYNLECGGSLAFCQTTTALKNGKVERKMTDVRTEILAPTRGAVES